MKARQRAGARTFHTVTAARWRVLPQQWAGGARRPGIITPASTTANISSIRFLGPELDHLRRLAAPSRLKTMVVNSPEERSKRSELDLQVLVLNSGSSSLKFGLYQVCADSTNRVITGEAEAIGEEMSTFHATNSSGNLLLRERAPLPSQQEAVIRVTKLLSEQKSPTPQIIGHRIVHGGPHLKQHCRIDGSIMTKIEAAAVFAPLHVPAALSVIRYARIHFPGIAQVACFDTSFHAHMPLIASVLPIPRALRADGVQRYGFHGLSCESIVRQLAGHVPNRLAIAHLGNGASVTAVKNGQSIDTSMGLTPTGGIIMGTRSGDLDPGVLIYLARQQKLDPMQLEELVDRHSGLLGISGVSSDLRDLHKVASSDPDVRLAIDMFCYTAAKELAAMSAVLEGLDTIVFTGGIGENDSQVRALICGRLAVIGVRLDPTRNRDGCDPISDGAARCQVRILPSQQNEQIAHEAWSLY